MEREQEREKKIEKKPLSKSKSNLIVVVWEIRVTESQLRGREMMRQMVRQMGAIEITLEPPSMIFLVRSWWWHYEEKGDSESEGDAKEWGRWRDWDLGVSVGKAKGSGLIRNLL